MNRLLPTLLLPLLLAGCFSSGTPPLRHYTVLDPPASQHPVTPANLDISVRMAPDLRAADAPTLYRADGSVSTLRVLTYYAPLELAIPRALRERASLADFGLQPGQALVLHIHDFCVDYRTSDGIPVARITLSANGHTLITTSQPLPANATPAQIRATLADCLLKAIRRSLAQP